LQPLTRPAPAGPSGGRPASEQAPEHRGARRRPRLWSAARDDRPGWLAEVAGAVLAQQRCRGPRR
jgi:hypothetical protein